MSFFDSKEEILSVELTDYGKYLLSKGKFNPKYYAFYDDDIIYDGKYAKIEEEQNDIQDRILNKTALLKPQANKTVKDSLANKEIFTGVYNLKKTPDLNDKSLLNSLGTCDYNTEYVPAWQISVMSGTIETCTQGVLENKEYGNNKTYQEFINIPQINIKTEECLVSDTKLSEDYVESVYASENDKIIYYLEKSINKSFFIEEKNTENNRQNFSIEVFMKEDDSSDWQQLHFYKQDQSIKNNILLDEPIIQNSISFDDKYAVDTYLQIYLDNENIIIDNKDLQYNLYTTNISEEDAC